MRVSAALAVAALVLGGCGGPTRVVDFAAEDEKEHWKEIPVKLPSYPRNENLVQFDVGEATPHRFYIDRPSLSVGEDGVVRYALLVRTAGGATNVTFEGIRCDGRRQKYYAVGEAGGTWTPARNPHWRRIQVQDPDRRHRALVDTYLCEGRLPRKSADILQRLRYGPPESETFGPPDRPFQ
jgi:CNP1-like family protein